MLKINGYCKLSLSLFSKNNSFDEWTYLSANPNAIWLLENNLEKINWRGLSMNDKAMHLLEDNIKMIDYDFLLKNTNSKAIKIIDNNKNNKFNYLEWLSYNKNAINFLEENPDKICWDCLSANPNAIHLLEANQEKIDWDFLSLNPNAIHLLEANFEKINWLSLSRNPNAIHILEANPEKINWNYLCENPNAIHLLKANPEKIDWKKLSANPNSIDMLEVNPDKIDWNYLSQNKNIKTIELFNNNLYKIRNTNISIDFFLCNPYILSLILVWDYKEIKKRFYNNIGKAIIEWIYHPKNIEKWGKNCWDLDII